MAQSGARVSAVLRRRQQLQQLEPAARLRPPHSLPAARAPPPPPPAARRLAPTVPQRRRARPARPAPPARSGRAAALRLPRIPPRLSPDCRARGSLTLTGFMADARAQPPRDLLSVAMHPAPVPTLLSPRRRGTAGARDASLCETRRLGPGRGGNKSAVPIVRPSPQCVKLGRATAWWWW